MESGRITYPAAQRFSQDTSLIRILQMVSRIGIFGFFVLFPGGIHSEDIVTFDVQPSKSAYITGDTVILAVKVQIKPQYYLYGNPVGPGGGRPLVVSIGQKYPVLHWIEVKKLKAEKIGPPFGDWVWAYRKETVLFCTGVVVQHNKNGVIAHNGSIYLEGLLCRDACRLQNFTLPYSITIAHRSYVDGHFCNDPDLLRKYTTSLHMADLPADIH